MDGEELAGGASDELGSNLPDAAPITVAVERHVAAHRREEALAWVQAGTSLASRMPGYLGSGWVRTSESSTAWYMLYRFADADSLAGWERSPERHWWLSSGEDFVHDTRTERRTGIEGWFDVASSQLLDSEIPPDPRRAPPRWKQAVSIWLGFFPTNLVVSVLLALVPGWLDVPLPLRVLLTTLALTPVMTYAVLPFVTTRLRPWLDRGPSRAGQGVPP